MTKQEIAKLLKSGQDEFAAGSSSGYDRYNLAHVRLIDLDGQGADETGRSRRGIVVELIGDSNRYRMRGKDGQRLVVDSARWIQSPWPTYVEQKAQYDRRQRATEVEVARRREVAMDAEVALIKLGIREGVRRGRESTFQVEPDTMAAILALIPVPEHV